MIKFWSQKTQNIINLAHVIVANDNDTTSGNGMQDYIEYIQLKSKIETSLCAIYWLNLISF